MLAALGLIAIATLTSQSISTGEGQGKWCLTCAPASVADAVVNLVLFVPFGAVFAFWRGLGRISALQAVAIAAAISSAIEVVQAIGVVDGRIASLADIVCNAAGAGIGALLALISPRLLRPSRSEARVLLAVWCIAIHLIMFASAWALQRPGEADSFEVRKSTLPFTTGYGWFAREIPWATVDGVRFENTSGSGAIIVEAPQRASHQLEVAVAGRDKRKTLVPMLFVHSQAEENAHVMIGQRGDEYGMLVRVNAERLGLRMPLLAIDASVQSRQPNDTTQVMRALAMHGDIGPKAWTLSSRRVEDHSPVDSTTLRLRPSLGWMLVAPVYKANDFVARCGTVLFVLILSLPMLHWSFAGVERRAAPMLLGLIPAISGLVVPAWWAGLSMPTAVDGIGLVLAGALAWTMAAATGGLDHRR